MPIISLVTSRSSGLAISGEREGGGGGDGGDGDGDGDGGLVLQHKARQRSPTHLHSCSLSDSLSLSLSLSPPPKKEKDTGGLIRTTSGSDQNIRWYDGTTARFIRTYFQADFERFNFSRDPGDTYVDSWGMQADFAAAEANLKTMALL